MNKIDKNNIRKLCLLLEQLEVSEILAFRSHFERELKRELKNGGLKVNLYFSLIDLLSAWRQIQDGVKKSSSLESEIEVLDSYKF